MASKFKPVRLSDELKFGKYKGRTVLSIADENAGYLVFLLNKLDGFDISPVSKKYVLEMANIQEHNATMKAAYGGMNRKQDWGFVHDHEMQD